MKKWILVLALVLASTVKGFAYDLTLLSTTTSTGTGTPILLSLSSGVAVNAGSCVIVWGGTTPTNTIVYVEGSLDGITWPAQHLVEVTSTASGELFHWVNKPVKYLRGNYVSKTGGDATTSVTMKCYGIVNK